MHTPNLLDLWEGLGVLARAAPGGARDRGGFAVTARDGRVEVGAWSLQPDAFSDAQRDRLKALGFGFGDDGDQRWGGLGYWYYPAGALPPG